MARQEHSIALTSGSYPSLPPAPGSLDVALMAASIVEGELCVFVEDVIIVASNRGASTARVTIESAPGRDNRSGDIVYDIGPDVAVGFGPFKAAGWIQADGNMYFRADNQTVYFGVVKAAR